MQELGRDNQTICHGATPSLGACVIRSSYYAKAMTLPIGDAAGKIRMDHQNIELLIGYAKDRVPRLRRQETGSGCVMRVLPTLVLVSMEPQYLSRTQFSLSRWK